jgi:DNA-binding transcriptional ArsR family regulator/uncharacterized protein YndB with AHSA1/START domain
MQDIDEAIWKALGDHVRRTILDQLRDGPKTTGALAALFEQTRFGVMKHLDVLEGAGLIAVERRGRERWNYLNAPALKSALDRWLTPFQHLWTNRLAALAQAIEETSRMSTAQTPQFLDIRQEVELAAPMDAVFAALTKNIDRWWLSPYRQTGAESRLELLPVIGSAMIEESLDGRHKAIWARVEEVHEPHLLYLSGRFAVTGAVAGRIHFDLKAEGETGCRLTVSHQAFGAIGEETQGHFTEGWRDLLDRRLRAFLAEDR